MSPPPLPPDRPWRIELLLLAGFGALTLALAAGALLDVDVAVRDWCQTHRYLPLPELARVLNFCGSANLLAPVLLALGGWLALRGHTLRPILLVVVTFASGYLVVVPLKMLTDRAAPHSAQPDSVHLFANDSGWSYPSGHLVNAVIWYPLLILLIEQLRGRPLPVRVRRVLRVAPVVVVTATVTYLGFHWLTDAAAGLLLGLALERTLRRTLPVDQGKPAGNELISSRRT
jgi:membrane-associated phospholipid phosphatase